MFPGLVWRLDIDGVYRWVCGSVAAIGVAAVAKGQAPTQVLSDLSRWITGREWNWPSSVGVWTEQRTEVVGNAAAVIGFLATAVFLFAASSGAVSMDTRAPSTWVFAWAVALQTESATKMVVESAIVLAAGVLVWWRSGRPTPLSEHAGLLVLSLLLALADAASPLGWALARRSTRQQVDAKSA